MIKTELGGFLPALTAALSGAPDMTALSDSLRKSVGLPDGYASQRDYLMSVRYELNLLLDIVIAEAVTPADLARDRIISTCAALH